MRETKVQKVQETDAPTRGSSQTAFDPSGLSELEFFSRASSFLIPINTTNTAQP
jgi:hypothetical protein